MMPRFWAQMAYELSEGTLYPLQTFKKGIDNPGDEHSLYEELRQFQIIVTSTNHMNSCMSKFMQGIIQFQRWIWVVFTSWIKTLMQVPE